MKKMETIRFSIFAVCVMLITIILFTTLSQEPFLQQVSAKVLFWETKDIPVLYYVSGAFIMGLFIGGMMAIGTWFAKTSSELALKKEVKLLKKEIDELKASVPAIETDVEEASAE